MPRDPEDRRFLGGPLKRVLECASSPAKVDLVHIHTPFIAHYAGVRFAREHGLPVVATYHTFFEDYLHHYVPVLPRGIGRWIARRFTLSQCDGRRGADLAQRADARRVARLWRRRRRSKCCPRGFPAESYVRGDGARFRQKFDLPARSAAAAVRRAASPSKRTSISCCACSCSCARSGPMRLFVIAGEGPARAHLAKLARELGDRRTPCASSAISTARTDLPDCYAAGDAFVFASRTETQGLVLLEAMAQGTPVVSTAELGTRSILTAGLRRVRRAGRASGRSPAAVVEALALPAGCARRAAVARARGILGLAGHGAAAGGLLRAGDARLDSIERGPIGTPFRVERSS